MLAVQSNGNGRMQWLGGLAVGDDTRTNLHAFFHTNRRVSSPSSELSIAAHTGWWASSHNMKVSRLRGSVAFHNKQSYRVPIHNPPSTIYHRTRLCALNIHSAPPPRPSQPFEKGTRESRYRREEFPYHSRFASHQAFKYQWLAAINEKSRWAEPWLLMDTDTVVQCSAAELRERFARFHSPLVVGGEFQWWPKRDKTFDPWPAQSSGITYPNSGMLMGTRDGYAALERAFQAMPRYPCCAKIVGGRASSRCHIDDQHCLQTALLLGSGVKWAIDANASLFLNLMGVDTEQLVRRDGRCFYTRTGQAPCVIHSNGKAAKPLMAHVFACKPDNAWVVPSAVHGRNLSAAQLFPTTH
jgi:hypothetical protein